MINRFPLLVLIWLLSAKAVIWGQSPPQSGRVVAWGQTSVTGGSSGVIAVAAGDIHAAGLMSDGTVVVWGQDEGFGDTYVPAGLSGVTALAAGDLYFVALKGDGTVVAWGYNSDGQTTVPAGLHGVTAIAAGEAFTMALKSDGTVVAWGGAGYNEQIVPAGLTNVTGIAAAGATALALKGDGTLVGWGYNPNGVNGPPIVPSGVTHVKAIGPGLVALKDDGTVLDWYNPPPAGLSNVVAVASGGCAVALKSDGTVVAWGDNTYGETNIPAGLSGVLGITAGFGQVVAIVPGPPGISVQPSDAVANGAATATFGVTAIGTAPLAYQWYYNTNTPLAGATNATLTLADVQTNQAGTYTVVITNPYGNVTSAAAVLAVNRSAQTINFAGGLHSELISAPPFKLGATASSGLPVGYTSSNPGVATVSGNTVTVTGAGTTVITVTQAGDGAYLPASASQTLQVVATAPGGSVVAWAATPGGGFPAIPAGVSNVTSIAANGWNIMALQGDGTVVAWGQNISFGETNVPAGLSGVVAIAAGGEFDLALKNDGTVVAWGGQTNLPTGLTNVTAIAAGRNFAVALRSDGTVVAWGQNDYGQTNVPPGLTGVTAIAAGSYAVIALKNDGTVVVWGYVWAGDPQPPGLIGVTAVAAGEDSFAVWLADGTVVEWGYSGNGQTAVPAFLSGVTALSFGSDFTEALLSDGTVVAWGDDGNAPMSVPTGLRGVTVLAAGGNFTLALGLIPACLVVEPLDTVANGAATATLGVTAIGTAPLAYQWYFNTNTPLVGATNATLTLTGVQTNQAGAYTVVLTNPYGSVTSAAAVLTVNRSAQTINFGPLATILRSNGPFALGATASSGLPVGYSSSNPGVATVSGNTVTVTGYGTTLITATQAGDAAYLPAAPTSQSLTVTGTAQAIRFGPLAAELVNAAPFTLGATSDSGLPVSYTSSNPAVASVDGDTVTVSRAGSTLITATQAGNLTFQPATSVSRTLYVRSPGRVVAWGDDNSGESDVPSGLIDVTSVAAGAGFNLALMADGTVAAWGDNYYGETTGFPTQTSPYQAVANPVTLSGLILTNVVALAAGNTFALALRSDSTVAAWGDNTFGQATVPVGLTNVIAITAGEVFAVALKSDGTVVEWGYGLGGVPDGLENVVAIAAGGNTALALRRDGTVVAWGDNTYGQATLPVGLTNVTAITAGSDFALALRSDGRVVAWGSNIAGQTNVPAGLTNVVAIAAGDFHTVVLEQAGTVVAWGDNGPGESDVPAGLNGVTAVAAGGKHTVALTLAPALTAPSTNLTVNVGITATFGVTAIGTAPLAYQWYYNTNTPLAGATNATLTLTDVQTNQAGAYSVVITSSYGGVTGTVTAPPAQLTVDRLPQTIAFGPLADQLLGNAPFSLEATASSGLPISYTSSNPGVAAVNGNSVTITGSGTTTITAAQAGDATYLPAAEVSQPLPVVNAWRSLPDAYWPNLPITVTIRCVPPSGTVDYAIEDDVAYGNSTYGFNPYASISAVSDGGTISQNGVKWGPFFDDSPRTLTYVVTPSPGLSDLFDFSGTLSINGVGQPVAGMTDVSFNTAFHPADNDPVIDHVVTLDEVTAYAAAWKNSQTWPVAPNPIPINYMTQAGLLWKGGEYYVFVPSNAPPFCWVNAVPPSPLAQTPPALTATNAFRSLTNVFAPHVPFTVTLTITPAADVSVYAVEEQVPPGLAVGSFSLGGVFDAINQKIKWGPFFDHLPRNLTYQATAQTNAPTTLVFAGAVSYDGSATAIAGTRSVGQALATVSLGRLAQTYDGTPRSVSVTTVPPLLAVDVTYNGSSNLPVNAGNYTVIATVTDPIYRGAATNALVVAPALATVSLGKLAQTYDGTPRSVSVTTVPPLLAVGVTYNGSSNVPVNAGNYTVIATVTDPNYQGGATNTLVVGPAATLPAPQLYSSFGVTNGQLAFATQQALGRMYLVEYKTNLSQPDWIILAEGVIKTTLTSIAEGTSFDPDRFYRIRILADNPTDLALPTVTVTTPAAGQQLTNSVLTVDGTAQDDTAVAAVFCQLDGAPWVAAGTTNGWTNWMASLALAPGTHSVRAYAVDASGNNSVTNAVSFQAAPPLDPPELRLYEPLAPAQMGQPYHQSVGEGAGGTPPYHFVLVTAGGFPPLGIIMDLNGVLSGKASVAGTYHFGVCVVDLVGAQDCGVATLVVEPAYQLTISTTGTGTGTVTANPPGPTYTNGTVVTLTATPDAGSTFAGWSGAASGTGTTTVTMNGNLTVTATFNLTPPTGFTGTWQGTWTNSLGVFGENDSYLTLVLTQTGTTVQGSYTNNIFYSDDGSLGVTSGPLVDGSVTGGTLLIFTQGGTAFQATIKGTTMSGVGSENYPVFTGMFTGPILLQKQ